MSRRRDSRSQTEKQLLYELGEKQEETPSRFFNRPSKTPVGPAPLPDRPDRGSRRLGEAVWICSSVSSKTPSSSSQTMMRLASQILDPTVRLRADCSAPMAQHIFSIFGLMTPSVQASLGEALGLPAEMAAVLPPAYLVDSPADAQRLAHSNPGVAFISRDRLWAQAGADSFPGSPGQTGSSGSRARARRYRLTAS